MTQPRLAVSIQAIGFEDRPWEGHRGQALLADPDRVVAFSPVPDIVRGDQPFELLVIPLPVEGGRRVERLRPVQVTLVDVVVAGEKLAMAEIALANDSRHEPNLPRVLVDRLDRPGGDLWTALESIGALASGQRDVVTPDLLRAAAKVERAQRNPVRVTPPPFTADEPACRWIPRCRSDQPSRCEPKCEAGM